MKRFWQRVLLVHIPLALVCMLLSLTTFGVPKGEEKIDSGLAAVLESCESSGEFDTEIPVIIQFDPDHYHPHGAPPGLLKAKALDVIEGYAGQMTVREIRKLAKSKSVERISLDAALSATSGNPFVSSVGIDQYNSWSGVRNSLGYDGQYIRVAVFDSGIAAHHDSG